MTVKQIDLYRNGGQGTISVKVYSVSKEGSEEIEFRLDQHNKNFFENGEVIEDPQTVIDLRIEVDKFITKQRARIEQYDIYRERIFNASFNLFK